ncbi:MAG: DUF692 family multinuclear iron-containing protein [Myxococcota bacterium]
MTAPRFGAGFRTPHFDELVRGERRVDWLEILTENFLGVGGAQRAMLERVRADTPLLLHGVSLSIAGADPLSRRYLGDLRALADALEPEFVSDHLSWTALRGHQSHDLLPVAFTREVLDHVAARVTHVQELLARPILLENATVYVAFRASEMSEGEFMRELSRRTGCGLLLDVNNLYVNAENLGIDPDAQLAALPRASVGYMHLAGHAQLADVRIDTHDADVPDPVWELFERAVARFPDAGVIVERDDSLPSFAELCGEVEEARARHAHARATAARAPAAAAPGARATSPGGSLGWGALQRDFWSRVIDKPIGFDHGSDARLGALLADDRPVGAARGLRVYSDAYGENLRRALSTNFPALARALRGDDFAQLCAAYLRAHPPSGHDYRELGARLAEYLAAHVFSAEYGVEQRAFADLAALEHAQLAVQEATDEPARVSPAELAAIPAEKWGDARFQLAPAIRLVRASHDVLPAVESVANGEPPARPDRRDVCYLVQRLDGGVRSERIGALDATIFESLAAGRTFSEACAAAQASQRVDEADAARAAAHLLVAAGAHGLLVSVTL